MKELSAPGPAGPTSSEVFRKGIELLCLKLNRDVVAQILEVDALTFEQYLRGERQVPRALSSMLCGMLEEQSQNLAQAANVLEAALVSEYRELSLLDELRAAAEKRHQPNPSQN